MKKKFDITVKCNDKETFFQFLAADYKKILGKKKIFLKFYFSNECI